MVDMSKKYESRVKELEERRKEKKNDPDHIERKDSSFVDGANINRQSVSKQKKALKNIKKNSNKSNKIW